MKKRFVNTSNNMLMLNMFTGINVFAADDSKQISIRVEGINSTIISEANYETKKSTVYEAVYEVLQSETYL